MAKKITFTLEFDAQKLAAIRTFAAEKGVDLEAEFGAFLEKKYKQIVPKNVRQYIDGLNGNTTDFEPKPESKCTKKPAESDTESRPETAVNITKNESAVAPVSDNYWNY